MNKVTKFARILNLRFLDYRHCTCKIPGQDHFGAFSLIFIYDPIPKILCHFLRLLECKRMTLSYVYFGVLEQGDILKKVVSRGWCYVA